MIPYYFPFTFIPDNLIRSLSALFNKVAVYQPLPGKLPEQMKQGVENGFLGIIHSNEKDEIVESALKEYLQWTRTRQESGISFFKAQAHSTPFFDDDPMVEIKSSIKKMMAPPVSEAKLPANFEARLFLSLAQEFDIQQFDLAKGLRSIEEKENKLFSAITGEADNKTTKAMGAENHTKDHMINQRITAWSRIMEQLELNSSLLLTSSESVIDFIKERHPQGELFVQYNQLPLTDAEKSNSPRDILAEYLSAIHENPDQAPPEIPCLNESGQSSGSFSLYRFAVSPEVFLAGLQDSSKSKETHEKTENHFQYTFLGIVGSPGID